MSYNIHHAIGLDRRFRPERIVKILAYHKPDLALLQEVDHGVPRSGRRDLTRDLVGALGYPYYAVGHNVTLKRGRYGNATLSRFPIVRERNIDLTIDRRKRRGCLHTTVEAKTMSGYSHRLEVFNLHLGLSAMERTRQIGKLVRAREYAEMHPGATCVIGGDFNDWRSLLHPILTEILDFRCATQSTASTNRALRTFPSLSPTGSLDKVYYRGGMSLERSRVCRLRVSRVASDHRPVIVDFELV